jgi:hypothetical protein
VLSRRVRSGFFFRDIGKLEGDAQTLDATRSEIEDALALRRSFIRFYAAHRTAAPQALHAAFADWCRNQGVGLPLPPLVPLERRVPDEHRWIRRVVEMTLRLQERNERTDSEPRKRRVAHTKHHGFMHATFEVNDNLDPRYAKGIFREPGTYRAVVRTSNTSDTRVADSKRDGRGISIKVLDAGSPADGAIEVPPEKTAGAVGDNAVRSAADEISQDFLLISHPVFFCRDVRDFAVFRTLVDVAMPERWLARSVFALQRLRRAIIFARIIAPRIHHPFELVYHSMTPYALGDDTAVKYVVEARDRARFGQFRPATRTGANTLSVALQESLTHEPIELDFFIHAPPPGKVDVEDPTVDWDRDAYPPVHVATLTIPPQDPATREALERGERTVFSPWNARAEHRPLGSLNRARLAIYRASAEARRGVAPGLERLGRPPSVQPRPRMSSYPPGSDSIPPSSDGESPPPLPPTNQRNLN